MTPPSFSAVPAIWAFISSFVAWSNLLFITFSNVLTLYFQNLYDLGFVTVVCKCNSDFVLYSYFLSPSASVCVRDIVSHFFILCTAWKRIWLRQKEMSFLLILSVILGPLSSVFFLLVLIFFTLSEKTL